MVTAPQSDVAERARETAERIGRYGVWTSALGTVPAPVALAGIRQIEQLGYGAAWIGETPRMAREVFTQAGLLLGATQRIVVATGIANIWLRQAATAAAAAGTLAEAYDDRLVLGVGASHPAAAAMVGEDYSKPLTAMRGYLEDMATGAYLGPAPARPVPVVVAALRPKMQLLAREAADGLHSFFVTPDHTAAARERLGPAPLLVPEQAVVLGTDAERVRARARAHVQTRLKLPAYVAHLRAMGFAEEDLTDGGSDLRAMGFAEEDLTDGGSDRLVGSSPGGVSQGWRVGCASTCRQVPTRSRSTFSRSMTTGSASPR